MKKGKKKLHKNQKIQQKNKIIRYVLISFVLLCIILVSLFTYNTYSLWINMHSQTSSNVVSIGCFQLQINDLDENNKSTAINLNNTYPMSEDKGLSTSPYILNITNICDIPSEYNIILNEFENTTLSNSLVRYQIKTPGDTTPTRLLSNANKYNLDESLKNEMESKQGMAITKSYNLATGYLNKNESVSYELRIWLDYIAENDAMNKHFEAGVMVLSTSPQ